MDLTQLFCDVDDFVKKYKVNSTNKIAEGKNWTPDINSAAASSPKAKKKSDRPNVFPVISNNCNAVNIPFTIIQTW